MPTPMTPLTRVGLGVWLAAVVILTWVAALWVPTARAAFPGRNGVIAYQDSGRVAKVSQRSG